MKDHLKQNLILNLLDQRKNNINNNNNKGNLKSRLPFLLITTIFLLLTSVIVIAEFKTKKTNRYTPPKKEAYDIKKSSGIIYEIDSNNNTVLINHNKIIDFLDSYDNISTSFSVNDSNILISSNISSNSNI